MVPSSEEILKKVNDQLEAEGITLGTNITSLEELISQLRTTKDTLRGIERNARRKFGFIGKLKTLIEQKIQNIVLNTVEHQSVSQQEYNDTLYKTLVYLAKENELLRKELETLKQ